MKGLIITAVTMSRSPSRPFPASPDHAMSYAGNGRDSEATRRKYGRSYDRVPNERQIVYRKKTAQAKRKTLLYWLIGLSIVAIFQTLGCAVQAPEVYVRDGKTYGQVKGAFRHRWWNYYERALSLMEGQFYEEALQDLDTAVSQRDGDQRMARTYGMHFVDYFPHREKGLVYYLTGDYDTAWKEFELSIRQQPSAKARFYIDKLRRIRMDQEKQPVSIPVLRMDLASDEIWTRDDPFIVSGTAEDKQYISRITLAGERFFMEGATQQIDFKKSFRLVQGEHCIDITAENLMGGKARHELIVHLDRQGPIISLDPNTEEAPLSNRISGYLYDESGRMALTVNGVAVTLPQGEEIRFTAPLKPGTPSVELLATDRLGNETRARLDLITRTAVPRHSPVRVAFSDHTDVVQDAGGICLASLFNRTPTAKPVIRLKGWTEAQTVFMDKVFLEGEVRGESDIVKLTVNGTPVLRRPGRMIFFNHCQNLQEGDNIVRVRAVDKEDQVTEHSITITRQVPEVMQLDSRFSISLQPFEDKGQVTGLNAVFYNMFMTELMDQQRFRIIEREKLDVILQEQKLSRTKLVDKATRLEGGRLEAAQATCIGNFIDSSIGIEAVARLVDNETSEVLAVKDVYDEYRDRSALVNMAEGMAVKFHLEFPLVDGLVVQAKKKGFVSDLGKGKVKPQRRLVVYRESEPIRHPVTGQILGCDAEIIGYARATQVMDKMSKAALVKCLDDETVCAGDKVMTQ